MDYVAFHIIEGINQNTSQTRGIFKLMTNNLPRKLREEKHPEQKEKPTLKGQ